MSQTVPEDILNTLRCSFCSEFLSVPPINIYPDSDRNVTTCGRCPTICDQNPVRNEPYERLATLFNYPCRYKPFGCKSLLSTDDVQQHEDSCTHRQYYCPYIPLGTCPWQGPSNELYSHYSECHDSYILQGPLELDLINKYEENYLIERLGDIFIFQMKSELQEDRFRTFSRFVGSKADSENFSFKIVISQLNGMGKVEYGPYNIGDDSSMSLGNCGAVVSITELKNLFPNPAQILCSVDVIHKEKSPSTVDQRQCSLEDKFDSVSMLSAMDEKLLQKLECPVCTEYMIPPIHQCVSGHSICGICKPTCKSCPLCKLPIGNTRNFILESMVEDINYPCKYAEYDCNYAGGFKTIKKHETECEFGPYSCPFHRSCAWKGKLSSLADHVRSEHTESYVDYEDITNHFDERKTESDMWIKWVFGSLFKVTYKYEHGWFYWSVQVVGPAEHNERYFYEITFRNSITKEQTSFVRNCSSTVTESQPSASAYSDSEDSARPAEFRVPYELIKCCWSSADEFTYKFIIKKKAEKVINK